MINCWKLKAMGGPDISGIANFIRASVVAAITVLVWPLQSQEAAPAANPSARQIIPLRLGEIDAVSGSIKLKVPLGPRLPGRLPIGFTWAFDSSKKIESGNSSYVGSFKPIVWRVPSDDFTREVWVNGESWRFLYNGAPTGGVPTRDQFVSWMEALGVDYGVSQSSAGDTFSIERVYSAIDGTKYFISISWFKPGSSYSYATRWVILSGNEGISTDRGNAIGSAYKTYITNRWGDKVSIIDGYAATAGGPETVTITNEKFPTHSITGTVTSTGLDSEGLPSAKLSITNTLGLPECTTTGAAFFYADHTPDGSFHCANLGILAKSIVHSVGSESRTISLQWAPTISDSPTGSARSLISITHPNGLLEQFEYEWVGNPSAKGFANGAWRGWQDQGFPVYTGPDTAAQLIGVAGNINPSTIGNGVKSVSVSGDGAGSTILISRVQPIYKRLSNSTALTWVESRHVTTILKYSGAAASITQAPYRGVRITHPSAGTWGMDKSSQQAYLFATSAVIFEEDIHGAGLSANLQPVNPVVDRLKAYDGWDARSWSNPTGTFSPTMFVNAYALPLATTPLRTRIFENGKPTKTLVAGDPQVSGSWDDRGPVKSDEYIEPPGQSWPTVDGSAPSAGSNILLSPGSASIKQSKSLGRVWNSTLGVLLPSQEQTALSGSNLPNTRFDSTSLPQLNGIASVDLGTKSTIFNPQGLPQKISGITGAYSADATINYLNIGDKTLPLPVRVDKTLSKQGLAIPANPDLSVSVGKEFQYDTSTPFCWVKSDRDLTDGRWTTYLRDGLGRTKTITDAFGTTVSYSYDVWGQVSSISRASRGSVGSLTIAYSFDLNGRWREEAVTADGRTKITRWEMDSWGRVTSIQVLRGDRSRVSKQAFTFDGWGQLQSRSPILLEGQASFGNFGFEYDEKGRLVRTRDPKGRVLQEQPDEPSWKTVSADGVSITGVVSTVLDDRSKSRVEVRDLLGQLVATIDQKSQLTRHFFDQYGRLTKTMQGSQIRTYKHNEMGWLLERNEPEEGTTVLSNYTMLGIPLLVTQKGRSGAGVNTTTKRLNQWLMADSVIASGPEGTVTRLFGYDPTSHLVSTLNETQSTVGVGTNSLFESYGYDPIGRIVSKTVSDGTETFVLGRTLDAEGRVTSLQLPSAGGRPAQTQYSHFDSLGRPDYVKLDGDLRGIMAYDQVSGSAVTRVLTFANGASTRFKSDLGELALVEQSIPGSVTESSSLSWTAGGLLLSRGNDSFRYDELGRLIGCTVQGLNAGETISQSFEFDRFGNRTSSSFNYAGPSKPDEVLAWTASYDDRNSLPSTVNTAGGPLSTQVQYDDLGRLRDVLAIPGNLDSSTQWVYDPSGRVMKETVKGSSNKFLLDGDGLRFRREADNGSLVYTLYGFNREPLMVFEKKITTTSSASPQALTATRSSKTLNTLAAPIDDGSGGGPIVVPPCGASIVKPTTGLTVAVGQAIQFEGSSPNGETFTWNFGDGTTFTGLATSKSYSGAGTFTVSFWASAAGFKTSVATVKITVMAAPVISSFAASPGMIYKGQTSTLSWSISGATSVTIDRGIGIVSGTSIVVSPTLNTTYTLTASNAWGSSTAQVTVGVSVPPPAILTFSATPNPIAKGSSTLLSWTTSDATSLNISGIGVVTGNSVAVLPTTTTKYTLTASSPVGVTTASVIVEVVAPPVIQYFSSNTPIFSSGQSIQLSWSVSGADTTSISGVGSVTGTKISLNPTGSSSFTLTATNLGGSTTATVAVSLSGVLTWKKTLLYGFGQLLSEEQADQGTIYVQSDQVGSPNILTNNLGEVVGRAKNLPFGERFGQWGAKSQIRFATHEDGDGSAIYMQARTYLPAYGRFAQPDPAYDQALGDSQSWNLYGYVTNNPVTHIDPDGMTDVFIGLSAEFRGDGEPAPGTGRWVNFGGTYYMVPEGTKVGDVIYISDADGNTRCLGTITSEISGTGTEGQQASSQEQSKVVEIAASTGYFALGTGISVGSNLLVGAPDWLPGVVGADNRFRNPDLPASYFAGRMTGDVLMAGWGFSQMVIGLFGEGLGGGLTLTGGGAIVGVPAMVVSTVVVVHGAGVTAASIWNLSEDYKAFTNAMSKTGDGGSGQGKSVNQMQKEVESGNAPKGVESVHKGNTNTRTQDHVHFKDGTSLNRDGTVHDKGGGTPNPTKEQIHWLRNNGWNI